VVGIAALLVPEGQALNFAIPVEAIEEMIAQANKRTTPLALSERQPTSATQKIVDRTPRRVKFPYPELMKRLREQAEKRTQEIRLNEAIPLYDGSQIDIQGYSPESEALGTNAAQPDNWRRRQMEKGKVRKFIADLLKKANRYDWNARHPPTAATEYEKIYWRDRHLEEAGKLRKKAVELEQTLNAPPTQKSTPR